MTAMRSRGALRLQTREAKLRLAAATARSMSAAVPALTSHSGAPVAGFTTVNRPRADRIDVLAVDEMPGFVARAAARACQSLVVRDVKFIVLLPINVAGECPSV